jgi:peptidoglycan/LPS O-acetylase OafA/YrhL
MSRLSGRDLLRAVAIIWVMFNAFNADLGTPIPFIAPHGWMAVDLFLVSSGFVIG